MSIEERIRIVLLLERMHMLKSYSEKLGLEDRSRFHGKRIEKEEVENNC